MTYQLNCLLQLLHTYKTYANDDTKDTKIINIIILSVMIIYEGISINMIKLSIDKFAHQMKMYGKYLQNKDIYCCSYTNRK